MTWKEAGIFVSEPVFVPKPHANAEDEGVLCVTLLNATSQSNVTLLILDAKTLREEARIKFSYHSKTVLCPH